METYRNITVSEKFLHAPVHRILMYE
jgi:hypothetical protein